MTYYELLEISENASEEVIHMAYKALVKKYHPDVYIGDKNFAEEKMKAINEAYSVLSDSVKRSVYDAFLKRKRAEQGASEQNKQSETETKSQPEKVKKGGFKKWILLAGALFIAVLLILPLTAISDIETVKDSVVLVEVYDENNNEIATGSGFCAFNKNWIITNFHVVEGAGKIKIVTDDYEKISVEDIVFFNRKKDIAVLLVDGSFTPLKIGDGENIQIKDKITTIGSPKGELNTVSEGIISNVDDKSAIRITAPISHGSSGGVLLNSKHEVIGITSAGYDDAQNLNFAINISHLEDLYIAYIEDDTTSIRKDNLTVYMGYLYAIKSYLTSETDCYTISDMSLFNKLTDMTKRFERLLSENESSWYSIYSSFSKADKQKVIEYLLELDSMEFDDSNIAEDIKDWNSYEFFISLDILQDYEYAIVQVDLDNYTDEDDIFNRVNDDYPLGAAEKSLINYLLGDFYWEDIHDDNKEDIFYYFDEKYGTEDMGAILELLGYKVEYESDGTLTAYW